MDRWFTHIAGKLASAVGQPLAFVVALTAIILWAASGPIFGFSDTWQLIVNTTTTIITFLMVFLIQNAQNRDAASMQSKLDELIRSHREARNEYIGIEHLTEKELEKIRADLEQECDEGEDMRTAQVASLNHLIRRR